MYSSGWRICVTPAASLTVTHSESQSACHPQYNTHAQGAALHTHSSRWFKSGPWTHISAEKKREGWRSEALEKRRIEDHGDFSCKDNYFLYFLKKKKSSEWFLSVTMCCGWSGLLCTCYIVGRVLLRATGHVTSFITVIQTVQIRNQSLTFRPPVLTVYMSIWYF